jgi:predicted porin
MKKSIVALAVSSAALASISAYAAEDTTVGFFGNIQYTYVTMDPKESSQASTHDFEDNGLSFGFKGESKVDDANTAYFKVKYKANETRKTAVDLNMDEAYIGVKGDFGNVKVGSYDSIYNDAIQDVIDQFEYIGFTKNTTSAEGKTIAYFTPTIAGFQLQLSAGLGEKTADDNTYVTTTKTDTAYTGVVKYSNDLVTVALGSDGLENKDTANQELGSTIGLTATVTPIENLALSAKYEKTSDKNSSNAGQKVYGLAARYGYGMGDVYGTYQKVKYDADQANGDDSFNQYGVGVTYSINSSMYVYAEVAKTDTSPSTNKGSQLETDVTALGVTYNF